MQQRRDLVILDDKQKLCGALTVVCLLCTYVLAICTAVLNATSMGDHPAKTELSVMSFFSFWISAWNHNTMLRTFVPL